MHIDTDTKTQTSTQGTTDIHTQTRAQILRTFTQFCCCAFACARCERPNILNFCYFVSTLQGLSERMAKVKRFLWALNFTKS